MRTFSEKAIKRYESKQIARIRKWQARRPGWIARMLGYLTTPVVWVLAKIIPHGAVEATLHGNMQLARWMGAGTGHAPRAGRCELRRPDRGSSAAFLPCGP